jgi:hypothetical protein
VVPALSSSTPTSGASRFTWSVSPIGPAIEISAIATSIASATDCP